MGYFMTQSDLNEFHGKNTDTTVRATIVLALLLGLAADQLLWDGPHGLGWLIWVALFGAGAMLLVRQAHFAWQRETAIAAGIAVCAATIPVLRASEAMPAFSLLLLVAAASIPLLRARAFHFGTTPAGAQLMGCALVGLHALGGAVPLLVQAARHTATPAHKLRVPLIAARGVLLALPPLALFLALFVSADPIFESYFRRLTQFMSEDFAAHAAFVLAIAWVVAGLLRGLLPRNSALNAVPAVPTLPTAELTVALGSIAALFFLFVLVQARWLYAGADAVLAIPGLTVANYARRGFFELLAAAALVLPLLVGADAASRSASLRGRYTVRAVAGALVVLVFAVMTSAFQRMTLYTERFGLTEQRLYGTALMIWLAVVFAWFLVTTLRGRSNRFAAVPVVAGIVGVLALAAVNPDAMIARINLDRASAGGQLDVAYLATLSADAAPEIIRRLDRIPAGSRCAVGRRLLSYREANIDWRVTNRSVLRARSLVTDELAAISRITELECPKPNPGHG